MKNRFVFVGTLDFNGYKKSFGIHTLSLNCENGELALIGSQEHGCNSSYLVVDSKGHYLYAVDERLDSGSIYTYQIDQKSKALNFLGKFAIPGAGCVHITISREDKFLLVSCWKTSNIIACQIGKDGQPEKVADIFRAPQGQGVTSRQTQPTPHQVVFDRSGIYGFTPDLGADRLHVFQFDNQHGKIRLIAGAKLESGAGPRHVAFHPNNRWVYALAELDNAIYRYDFNEENGEIVYCQRLNLLPEEFNGKSNGPEIQGAEIQVTPDGRFVFASMRGYRTLEGHDRIFRVEIDQDSGEMKNPASYSSYGICPRMFVFTKDNRFILICNQKSNEVISLDYDTSTGSPGKIRGRAAIQEAAVLASLDPEI